MMIDELQRIWSPFGGVMIEDAQNRFRGCLVGLAVGDAVGTTLEFRKPGTFDPIDDMVGGGPFGLKPGEWTDDTSMALCLAHSLIHCNGIDARDQMNRYLNWWRHGYMSSTGSCFDIGSTVAVALDRYEQTGNAVAGSRDPMTAGNGSLMRLAPVPMFFAAQIDEAILMCAESSLTTHGARDAVDCCRYYGGLLVGALWSNSKAQLLTPYYKPTGRRWQVGDFDAAADRVIFGSFLEREPPDIVGTGYVVRSMEAALWAFRSTENFRDGCLAAANLGDDADTTAAIYGQLAGAYYGYDDIPTAWCEKLAKHDEIVELADQLWNAACAAS